MMEYRSQRTKRLSFPALSVMAEGEPLVWLSGGALAVCIAMIVLLLAIIVWHGMATFWPSPVVQFTLRDGRILLGEIARVEAFRPSPDEPVQRRWLLRTGNFELTNTHFQWVTDQEVQADLASKPGQGEKPEWATTVERVEWGRFYGEPVSYQRDVRRLPSAEEMQLDALQTLLKTHAHEFTEAEQRELAENLPALESRLQALRVAATRESAAAWRRDPLTQGGILGVLNVDGTVSDLPEDPSSDFVAAGFRVQWDGSESAWREYMQRHSIARQSRQRLIQLEREEVGRCNRNMEHARLSLRRAELRADMSVLQLAQTRVGLEANLEKIESERAEVKMRAQLSGTLQGDPFWIRWLPRLSEILYANLATQEAEIRKELDRLASAVAVLPPKIQESVASYVDVQRKAMAEVKRLESEIEALREQGQRDSLLMRTSDGQTTALRVANIVRAYPANQLTLGQRCATYLGRWWEFIASEPREANSEGGVFPAIWGTVAMTLIMCLIVVPFGVLAALYLREYARAGIVVSAVRIAINNLAGVPSIVFGVFGLGFFCYLVGTFTDGGPRNAGIDTFPPVVWWRYLFADVVALLMGVLLVAYQLNRTRYEVNRWLPWVRWCGICVWLAVAYLTLTVILRNPYFDGLFSAQLPNPTYGKGGLLWASLTLALLTLPVVIVATEEALAAVPNSLREGSYASGASKWQTIRRIVLPHAMPGIMTGMILAMARGAGEVAPLMLVGAVKLAPELPLDGIFPFLHGDRSFMHLGFHIFDLGFQSQNSDAARPMVYTTTLLLIGIVATLNLLAISLRARLRKRFQGGQF